MTDAPSISPSILIVEDDPTLRLVLADNLRAEGYRVTTAETGRAARAAFAAPHDLIVLDLMLPDADGYALCRELRAAEPPGARPARVLMLTARALEDDLLRGFDAGADDYLAKPYRLRELLARVRALLRRGAPSPLAGPATLRFAGFTLDLDARTLLDPAGAPIALTRTEHDLLACFLRHEGRALSRDRLLDEVWGADVVVDPRTVDNFVSSLKRKLGWTDDAPFRFQAVRGVGYRLEVDSTPD